MVVRRAAIASAMATGILALGAGAAQAENIEVDDDAAECRNADFDTIQEGVDAAQPGDRVRVCEGVYEEQVRIGAGKDDVDVESRKKLGATIKYPAVTAPDNFLVRISESQGVTLQRFVITGPYNGIGCGDPLLPHVGVRVDGEAEAEIGGNHITEIRDANPALVGCQDGLGVQVGREFENETATAQISHNLIDEYQKGGVVIDNAGSSAEVNHNEVRGAEPDNIAPNGVQVGRGAAADVHHNEISRNQFATDPFAAAGTGIILFEQPDVEVDHNEVFDNDDGIALYDVDDAEVAHNYSHDNITYDGVFADSDSEGNLIQSNRLFDNAEHDCHDDSAGGGTGGTANTWKSNQGGTQNRPDLCKKATTIP